VTNTHIHLLIDHNVLYYYKRLCEHMDINIVASVFYLMPTTFLKSPSNALFI